MWVAEEPMLRQADGEWFMTQPCIRFPSGFYWPNLPWRNVPWHFLPIEVRARPCLMKQECGRYPDGSRHRVNAVALNALAYFAG